jgi:hypothetical protein
MTIHLPVEITAQSLIFSAFSINLIVPSSSSSLLSLALLTIVTLSRLRLRSPQRRLS